MRHRTRVLLNGRVYGQKRYGYQPKNPFANVHDEPEFVEWGHGGMGSNSNRSMVGGKTDYAVLQSGGRLSVGYVEGGGGGVGWGVEGVGDTEEGGVERVAGEEWDGVRGPRRVEELVA